MKVSVVITVKNEERTIKFLLDSLLSQSKKADEILIVDGGSIDKTIQIIEQYVRTYKGIRIMKAKASIAKGRNIGIKNAKNEIIVQTDAGCISDKYWLRRITKPFEDKKAQMAAGFYEMKATTNFQKALVPFLGITPDNFDPTSFLPSHRSVAFRKAVWEKVDGYSEKLTMAGEDTLFNHEVVKLGIPITRVKGAKVSWQVPTSFSQVFKKFFNYAKGDAEAGIWWHETQKFKTHNIKILLIYARYFLGLLFLFLSFGNPFFMFLLLLGFIFYIFWIMWKMRQIQSLRVRIWTPMIHIISDIAVMAGFGSGIYSTISE